MLQVMSRNIIHNSIDSRSHGQKVINLRKICMMKLFKDICLGSDIDSAGKIFLDLLDNNLLLKAKMIPKIYDTRSSLSDLSDYLLHPADAIYSLQHIN